MDVTATVQEPVSVPQYQEVVKIKEQPIYTEKIIPVERVTETIREQVEYLKASGQCMTGNEFVATWNELFRLKEEVQAPDKCLEQHDFVELVADNIHDNAAKLITQGQYQGK